MIPLRDGRARSDAYGDSLGLAVAGDRGQPLFAAYSGPAVATERGLDASGEIFVYEELSGIDGMRGSQRLPDITGEYARDQREIRAICGRNCLIEAIDRLDDQHGAENLVLHHRVA